MSGHGGGGGSRGATSGGPTCSTVSGQAHIRGLVTSRPCSSPGLHSKSGRRPARVAGLPIARVRGPVDGDVAAFVGARVRPGSRRRARYVVWCSQLSVAASQQNAASSRAHATATVPVCLPRRLPRCVQRPWRRCCARQAICTTLGSWPAWRAAMPSPTAGR